MWQIAEINNSTHNVRLTHTDGRETSVTIPQEHRGSIASKNAFLRAHTDSQDPPKTNVIQLRPKPKYSGRFFAYVCISIALVIMALEFCSKLK